MKNVNKIASMFICIFLLSLPSIAQKDTRPKGLQKQAKTIKKMLPQSEQFNGINTIYFEKIYSCNMRGLTSEQESELSNWETNNDLAMKDMPDIIYLGCKRIKSSWSDWGKFGKRFEYYYIFVPMPGNNAFPNQTISLADMKRQGAGYFYSDETYKQTGLSGNSSIEGEMKFFMFPEINWSGDITSGKLDGEGEGYCVRDGLVYFVKGKFNEGMPNGDCSFYRLDLLKKDVRHIDVKVSSFNEDGLAQVTKSDEVGKTFCISKSFDFVDIEEIARLGVNTSWEYFGRFQTNRVKWVADKNFIVSGTFHATNGDSLNYEFYTHNVGYYGRYKGITEKGKQSVLEYLKGYVPLTDQLIKVFNAKDISEPIKNLKTLYNVDVRNKIDAINNLLRFVGDAKSVYEANPDISDKIEVARNLYEVYKILEMDDTNTYNEYHNLQPSSYMEEKSEKAIKILDDLMNNPLFPRKDQAAVNAVKAKLKSKSNSYAQAWSKAKIEEDKNKAAQDAQKRNLDELVESDDIPRITSCEKKHDNTLGWYYAYAFEDGITGIIYIQKGTSFYMVDTGRKFSSTAYTNLYDAERAMYFYKKYGKERQRGQVSNS